MGGLARRGGLGFFSIVFFVNGLSCCKYPLPLSSFLKNHPVWAGPKTISPAWYQELPTVGLHPSDDAWRAHYPFLPHQFSLWQMAPRLGKGVAIVFIDSGIVACATQETVTPYLSITFDPLTNYNLSNKEALRALEELEALVANAVGSLSRDDTQNLSNKIILEYVQHKKQHILRSYLVDFGIGSLWESKARLALTEEGKSIFKKAQELCEAFHAVTVIDPETQCRSFAIQEFLPLDDNSFSHGTAVAALAAGKSRPDQLVGGVAPQASIIMIKAFSPNEQASGATFCAALTKALMTGAKIVNMSLARTNATLRSGWAKTAELLMSAIPYSVAAVANSGNPTSFPATMDCVTFSIGAFGYNQLNGEFPLAAGGPIVLPGVNLLVDAGKPTPTKVSGTSFAAPLMSGFLALMLSEFNDETEFTRDQLLKTCRVCTIKLMDDVSWQHKTALGTLDMRMALFTLHILRSFKHQENITGFLSDLQFDRLLTMICILLLGMINEYGLQDDKVASFESNFFEFYKALGKRQLSESTACMMHPIFHDFNSAIAFCVDCLRFTVGLSEYRPTLISDTLIKAIRTTPLFSFEKRPFKPAIINDEVVRYVGKADARKIQHAMERHEPYWQLQTTAAGTL